MYYRIRGWKRLKRAHSRTWRYSRFIGIPPHRCPTGYRTLIKAGIAGGGL